MTSISGLIRTRRSTRRPRPGPATPTLLLGMFGASAVVAVAVLGPLLTPYDPNETLGATYAPPDADHLLGTDSLGRDVISRVLDGGHTVLLYASIATLSAYVLGLAIGMFAGYSRGRVDQLLMRLVDVALAFPSLVFILLLAAAFGRGITSIVWATALIQATAIARVVRTATLEQSVRGFVEAAVARGERTFSILVREILPNISGTLAADIGIRFTWSVLLIASVNFLGLGLQPPAADWGLMISENRGGMILNPLSIVAPAAILGLLTVSINLIADAVSRSDR